MFESVTSVSCSQAVRGREKHIRTRNECLSGANGIVWQTYDTVLACIDNVRKAYSVPWRFCKQFIRGPLYLARLSMYVQTDDSL